MNEKAKNNTTSTWAVIVYHFCRIVLGAVFITAAYHKILEPWGFGRAIDDYQMLPKYFIAPMAMILPWVELVTGLLLIINRMVKPAAILIFLMNLMFLIAVAYAMIAGLKIDCGCGFENSPLEFLSGTGADGWALVRDIIFIFMTVWTYAGAKK